MSDGFHFRSITFPPDGSVLSGLDLVIGSTESVALFGPNGAGKSSLLRIVAGTAPGSHPLAEVAYLPQKPYMFRGTVQSNLVLGLSPDNSDIARRLAGELSVDHILGRSANEISVGEAQRIGLARTLASSAPLVLLDEPIAPINTASRRTTVDVIRQRTENRALLWATHSLEAVTGLADRLLVIDEGVIIRDGTVAEVVGNPGSGRVEEIIGEG